MNVQLFSRLSILILVAQFAGCANPGMPQWQQNQLAQAQQQAQQNAAQQAKTQEAKEYCASLYADSKFKLDLIRSKVPIDHSIETPISVEMMANSEFPTEDETPLILLWGKIRENCQQHFRNAWGEPPAHLAALQMAKNQALAELYAHRITYGQLSSEWNKYEIAYKQQDQAFRSQAQRDATQAQREFAQQLLQQQQIDLQRQQLINQQLQPIPVSNPVNCTTQYIGNTAYTNCR